MQPLFELPFQFDAAKLKGDYQRILKEDWLPHYNEKDYQGTWDVVTLRSVGGLDKMIYSVPADGPSYQDTELLSKCTYFQHVLATFEFPLLSVRLMNLTPGSRIAEHRDDCLGYEDGEIRLHVPILTNADVRFVLDGTRVAMQEGNCWYLDFDSRIERLQNAARFTDPHEQKDRINRVN